ncbi:alpha amylase N-terminal ig-like domain-containing protein [candidate division NPL-UPA2 bacterium]|nr:alpha amylase N-terminal ig-like domain-containing protein [candidate division NPL-UPA2 bacterium]
MKRIMALFLGLMMLSGLAGADGVRTPLIFHDTHDSLFRYPFGAVPAGKEVRLRIRAGVGDFTTVTVSAWDEIRRIRIQKPMEIVDAGSDGAFEYWEALISSDNPTILRYHFILKTEGERVVYYGDPGQDGGIGRAAITKPEGFQLTIYYGNFRTPDWAKNAIIYQIFVDRFYDGDPENNHAADERGFRGGVPIEH